MVLPIVAFGLMCGSLIVMGFGSGRCITSGVRWASRRGLRVLIGVRGVGADF